MNGPGVIEIAGGTYNANGDIVMGTNSQLTRDAAGAFNLTPGRTLTIQGGADAIFTSFFFPTGANVTLDGAGSTLQSSDNAINVVHATIAALKMIQRPEEVAARRGLPLEDVAPASMLRDRAIAAAAARS